MSCEVCCLVWRIKKKNPEAEIIQRVIVHLKLRVNGQYEETRSVALRH